MGELKEKKKKTKTKRIAKRLIILHNHTERMKLDHLSLLSLDIFRLTLVVRALINEILFLCHKKMMYD